MANLRNRVFTKNNITINLMGVSGTFDASLMVPDYGDYFNFLNLHDVMPIALQIELKVKLIQDNKGDGLINELHDPKYPLNSNYRFAPWEAAEWIIFKRKFLDYSFFWNRKFWLSLSDKGRASITYRMVERDLSLLNIIPGTGEFWICPNVIQCWFTVELVDSNEHCSMNVARLINRKTGRSVTHADYKNSSGAGLFVRSNAGNIYNGDVIGDDGHTIAHEIGHCIGIPHIGQLTNNPGCIGENSNPLESNHILYDGGADSCYADPKDDSSNVMGGGLDVDPLNAYPWRFAMQSLTGVHHSDFQPSVNRLVPNINLVEMTDDPSRMFQIRSSKIGLPFVKGQYSF